MLYWSSNALGIWLLLWGSGLPSPSVGEATVILGDLASPPRGPTLATAASSTTGLTVAPSVTAVEVR